MATKPHPGGRPALYTDPKVLEDKIKEYFAKGMKTRTVLVGPSNNKQAVEIPVATITGLVLYLGFADRHSFYDYEKIPKFSHTIKTARTLIEQEYEELLQTGLGSGAIFALKNFGWHDKTETDITSNGQPILGGTSVSGNNSDAQTTQTQQTP